MVDAVKSALGLNKIPDFDDLPAVKAADGTKLPQGNHMTSKTKCAWNIY